MNELKDKAEELKKKQEELRAEYENWSITTDEYKKKQEDLKEQMRLNQEQSVEYQQAMEILNNKSLSYAKKIDMINQLRLNPTAYNEVITKNKEMQLELIKSIQLQAQLLKEKQKIADTEFSVAQDKLPKVTNEWSLMTNFVSNDQLKALWIAGDKRNSIVEDSNKQLAKLEEERLKIEKEMADSEKKIKNTSISNTTDYNNKIPWLNWAWKDKAKKIEEEKKRIYEDSIKFQKKVFENAVKIRENDIKDTDAYIAKLKQAVEKITALDEEMSKLNADSTKSTMDDAGDRYRQLLEQQKEAKKDLDAATREYGAWLVEPEQKRLDSIINQIKELENSGLLDQNTKAKEQQRASLSDQWQARFDFQDKLWQIAIDKANKQAELLAKKTEIENDIKMKKDQAEKEILILNTRKANNEVAINKYKDMIALVEKWITDNTQKEIDKRMSAYAQEEQRLLRLIELRMQAWYAVGAITPTPVSNTSNTTVNQVVNATVNNNVDKDALARDLANRVALANKWISK